jgi:hypothetical protein
VSARVGIGLGTTRLHVVGAVYDGWCAPGVRKEFGFEVKGMRAGSIGRRAALSRSAGENLDLRALARELGHSEAPREERDVSWLELATELGYYDQAHPTREFRHFAGTRQGDTLHALDVTVS